MGSFWLLKLALKCIYFLSWPLLALGYPLCASIRALETDSHSDTRNLISYWILFSLIYLFENAFLKLLQWFQYWSHIKLMIIIWLVIPDFRRASYVYDHLVHSCISMNLQEAISRFMNWKKLFVKREIFLLQAEDYIKENGTEALEKLIASKSTMQNLDAEAVKAVPATEKNEEQQTTITSRRKGRKERLQMEQKDIKDLEMIEKEEVSKGKQSTMQNLDAEAVKAVPATEKNEEQQTIRTRLQMEQKDIKDLEMIEKVEVSKGKQTNSSAQSLELKENTTTVIVETEGIAGKATAGGESQSSESKKVQKEWACALCQVTTTCEKNLNMHLHGKKHKDTCEALKAKNQSVPAKNFTGAKKNDKLNEEPKIVFANASKPQKNTANLHAKIEPKKVKISNVQENSQLSDAPKQRRVKDKENKSKGDKQGVHASCGMNDSRLRCGICDVRCTSESDLASHLNGGRHLSRIKEVRASPAVELFFGSLSGSHS